MAAEAEEVLATAQSGESHGASDQIASSPCIQDTPTSSTDNSMIAPEVEAAEMPANEPEPVTTSPFIVMEPKSAANYPLLGSDVIRFPTATNVKLHVRRVTFEQFKNRFCHEDGLSFVEALYAGPDFADEMLTEAIKRAEYRRYQAGQNQGARLHPFSRREDAPKVLSENHRLVEFRVNSQLIQYFISQVASGHGNLRHAFHAVEPFEFTIHIQKKMQAALDQLKAKLLPEDEYRGGFDVPSENPDPEAPWEPQGVDDLHQEYVALVDSSEYSVASSDMSEDAVWWSDGNIHDAMFDYNPAQVVELANSKIGLAHLQAYVRFVDAFIMPLVERFQGSAQPSTGIDSETDKTLPTTVRFDDLYHLFQEGDLVFSSNVQKWTYTQQRISQDPDTHFAWRVMAVSPPPYKSDYERLDDLDKQPRLRHRPAGNSQANEDNLRIDTYCVDFDGETFGAVQRTFYIEPYSGERQITRLKCFPARFLRYHQGIISNLVARGSSFQSFTRKKSVHVKGWTLTHSPLGKRYCAVGADDDLTPLKSQYVDSQVILACSEAGHMTPSWRPDFVQNVTYFDNVHGDQCRQQLDIIWWTDRRRVQQVGGVLDYVSLSGSKPDGYAIKDIKTCSFLQHCLQLRAALLDCDSWKKISAVPINVPSESDVLVLLPRSILGYVLDDHCFTVLDTTTLYTPMARKPEQTLEKLIIPPSFKDAISTLIDAHFANRQPSEPWAWTKRDTRNSGPKDEQRVAILLHGPSGVGKTATAEVFAHKHDRPLFRVSCGGLDCMSEAMEADLKEIFRLASLWDCILVLEEIEILAYAKMYPNFVRMLERFDGVVFITTDNIDEIQPALRNRVNLSLSYLDLHPKTTRDIFKAKITRDQASPISWDSRSIPVQLGASFRKPESSRGWSSWLVKSTVKIAESFARNDYRARNGVLPRLSAEHLLMAIEMVRKADDRVLPVEKKENYSEGGRAKKVRVDPFLFPGNSEDPYLRRAPGYYSSTAPGEADYYRRPTCHGAYGTSYDSNEFPQTYNSVLYGGGPATFHNPPYEAVGSSAYQSHQPPPASGWQKAKSPVPECHKGVFDSKPPYVPQPWTPQACSGQMGSSETLRPFDQTGSLGQTDTQQSRTYPRQSNTWTWRHNGESSSANIPGTRVFGSRRQSGFDASVIEVADGYSVDSDSESLDTERWGM
ncbi:ATPase family associated with various cellular activities (AAA) [Ceratocystis lukuohia]|uniref:ATPase family associated with various cellular activities (AAA) n=1 Tax=Ceratocystis lukuohia TaxID=2019550 RepID=A0ABR4MCX4_9PEZI